ncbi:MAG: hypothetical protein IPM48_14390 [Saprospiraceae bacterium]|nr:hypothetical protein [Saprospiraceae bacterium]
MEQQKRFFEKESGAKKGLEMKMSGQAKGACFNKAVDTAIAIYAKTAISDEQFIEKVIWFFEAYKPINMEEKVVDNEVKLDYGN